MTDLPTGWRPRRSLRVYTAVAVQEDGISRERFRRSFGAPLAPAGQSARAFPSASAIASQRDRALSKATPRAQPGLKGLGPTDIS